MADGTLTIGNRRYSSWSLRGWLAVRMAGLDVEVVVIPLDGHSTTPGVKLVSPSGLVPYLVHKGNHVWESLALCEYAAEHKDGLWPEDSSARAWARSIAAEMHGGFRAVRQALPMNLGASRTGGGAAPEVRADITRIETIWRTTREHFAKHGPYLFGKHFTLADAMYAPVVARFLSYGPTLAAESRDYCQAVRANEFVDEWYRGAAEEPDSWKVDTYENVP